MDKISKFLLKLSSSDLENILFIFEKTWIIIDLNYRDKIYKNY